MSWDCGIFQPWMNVTASFFSFSSRGYLRVLNSSAKWGLCVAVCWMTLWYPHLDLGLKSHRGECVSWLPFPMALTWLSCPLFWPFNPPPPQGNPSFSSSSCPSSCPSSSSPYFPSLPSPTFLKLKPDWQCFLFPSFFLSFLSSFLFFKFVFRCTP